MEIKRVSLSEVEAWDKNPRNIKTKEFERLKKQIQELGVYKPLICFKENGKYVTLGGNMRLRALNALLISDVDISVVHPKTEADKIKYALSDNDRAGEYDEQALAELAYPHIEEINLEDYKLDVGQAISLKDLIEDYAPDVDGEDEVPEIDDSPAVTKMGDLFTLGKHRLLCGDATKEEDVKRLMGGEKADMVFTDPPYGVGENYNEYKDTVDNLRQLIKRWLPIAFEVSSVVLFTPGNKNQWLYPKPDWVLGWFTGGGSGVNPWGFTSWHAIYAYGKDPYLAHGLGSRPDALSKIDTSDKQVAHPSQKPLSVWGWFLERGSISKNDIIHDPFLGSGTTLIACEKLNRICYGMEIEPKYCDVIITRYSNFTDIPEDEIRAMREVLN